MTKNDSEAIVNLEARDCYAVALAKNEPSEWAEQGG